MLIKIQPDATVCRYVFTAKSLYMFRASQHPSSGVLKTVTAASGTGHNTGTATSLQRGPIGPRWRDDPIHPPLLTHTRHMPSPSHYELKNTLKNSYLSHVIRESSRRHIYHET